MRIQLHIERLILDGLPVERRDAPLVQAALEAEMARLLSTEGVAPALLSGGSLHSQHADSIQVGRDATPSQLGAQIAQAVYGGFAK